MLRLNKDNRPEFYFDSEANSHVGFTISTEELLFLAREARTIGEFRTKLITGCVSCSSEAKQQYDHGNYVKRKAVGA